MNCVYNDQLITDSSSPIFLMIIYVDVGAVSHVAPESFSIIETIFEYAMHNLELKFRLFVKRVLHLKTRNVMS
jgi:hypothetical protein